MLLSLKVPLYGPVVVGGRENADGVFWAEDPKGQVTIDRVEIVGRKRLL